MEEGEGNEYGERNNRRVASAKSSGRRTVVQLYGMGASSCGYCKESSFNSSISYGVVSQSMMAEDYETLMLIGWRRSGEVNSRILFMFFLLSSACLKQLISMRHPFFKLFYIL